MKRIGVIALFALLIPAAAMTADIRNWPEDDVIFDVVGQVKNAGTQSTQYGYLSYVNGLSADQTFAPGSTKVAYATYSTFGGDHLFRSRDGGKSWSPLGSAALPDVPANTVAVDPRNPISRPPLQIRFAPARPLSRRRGVIRSFLNPHPADISS